MSEQHLTGQAAFTTGMDTLGRYHLLQRVGRGGMGDVWLAEDPVLRRSVAIKTLPIQKQQVQSFVRLFEREAQAAAALNHPHILPVHSYGKQTLADGRLVPYIVMPYISHGSLADRIDAARKAGRLLPPAEIVQLLKQAAEAIDHAHRHRILHRDIKPANMLLRDDNWLLLSDFGIARIMSNTEQATRSGVAAGTPEYMAPEQAQGQANITSDNYSLAVIAYQLMTGVVPFQGDSAVSTIMKHVLEEPVPPGRYNPAITPVVEQAILQGLAKDPAQRPALASDYVAQIERAFNDIEYQPTQLQNMHDLPDLFFEEPTAMIRSMDPAESESKHPKVSRRRILIGACSAAALVAGGGLATWGYVSTQNSTLAAINLTARPTHTGPGYPSLMLTGQSGIPTYFNWSSDASVLYSLSSASHAGDSIGVDDNSILQWNIADLLRNQGQSSGSQLYSQVMRFRQTLIDAVWSPDGSQIVVASLPLNSNRTTLDIYSRDLRYKSTLTTIQHAGTSVTTIALFWLPDNHLLLMCNEQVKGGSVHCQCYLIDRAHPQASWQFAPLQQNASSEMRVSPDSSGRLLLKDINSLYIQSGSIISSGTAQPRWQPGAVFYNDHVSGLDTSHTTISDFNWSPDGKSVFVFFTSEVRSLISFPWNGAPKPKGSIVNFPSFPSTSSYSRNSIYYTFGIASTLKNGQAPFAVGDDSGNVVLWPSLSNGHYRTLKTGNPRGTIQSISISPDHKFLAAGDNANTIYVWQL
ncbi:protein kinase [Ktedonobacteria bacterium brp13]|nr:protein kinase [Ktedonobacteria bacterium brp13]